MTMNNELMTPEPWRGQHGDGEGREQAPDPHGEVQVVDLMTIGAELLDRAADGGRGFAVQTVIEQPGQRVLLLAFPRGGGLPEHDAPPAATLQCLTGAVALLCGEQTWELVPGALVQIPQARHDVKAHQESLCLLAVTPD